MTAVAVTPQPLGEVSPAQREAAVTAYLESARDRLSLALDASGPEAVAALKAEIATAAEATRQLGLSREIQTDAQEMVRRAEFSLGRAIRAGQAEGTIAKTGDNQHGREVEGLAHRKSLTSEFLPGGPATVQTYAMADAGEQAFEAALTEARAEGNVSRANVVRKLERIDLATGEIADDVPPVPGAGRAPKTKRKPLRDGFRAASLDLGKLVGRWERLATDDRVRQNVPMVVAYRRDLVRAIAALQHVLDQLPQDGGVA